MTSLLHTKGSRAKRGLPRPCQGCSQDFSPKNNKGKFCSEACKKARARLAAKTGLLRDPDTDVARVPFRSKSANHINGVSGNFHKPRVAPKSGWHAEGGQLVFYPMPSTPVLTWNECQRFIHGHMAIASDMVGVDASTPSRFPPQASASSSISREAD